MASGAMASARLRGDGEHRPGCQAHALGRAGGPGGERHLRGARRASRRAAADRRPRRRVAPATVQACGSNPASGPGASIASTPAAPARARAALGGEERGQRHVHDAGAQRGEVGDRSRRGRCRAAWRRRVAPLRREIVGEAVRPPRRTRHRRAPCPARSARARRARASRRRGRAGSTAAHFLLPRRLPEARSRSPATTSARARSSSPSPRHRHPVARDRAREGERPMPRRASSTRSSRVAVLTTQRPPRSRQVTGEHRQQTLALAWLCAGRSGRPRRFSRRVPVAGASGDDLLDRRGEVAFE